MQKSKLDRRGSSEEFATATHLLIGTILFTVIAVAIMFFFVSQDIKATFTSSRIDAEIIATRIIFSRNCYAYDYTINLPWYDMFQDDRYSNTLVRAGVIDLSKFNNMAPSPTPGYTMSQYILSKCAPYNASRVYEYNLSLENLHTATIYYAYPNPMQVFEGDADNCPATQSSAYIKKLYPVIIYNPTTSKHYNGVLDTRIRFCYLNESVKK